MKITYSIQVCNESRELYSLLNFLLKVKDEEDYINVVVDSLHTTDKVKLVTDYFKDGISVHYRPFDNFHDNVMFHREMCTTEYYFAIDADEMPQEALIKGLKLVLNEHSVDILYVPRINIHPGATQEFVEKSKFQVNEGGWINWPDYQGRILKKDVMWTDNMHPVPIHDGKKVGSMGANPGVALWHIKSIEKQESRWSNSIDISSPTDTNLYDLLM